MAARRHARKIIRRRINRVPRRIIQDRTNPLEYLQRDHVFDRFRFFPETILYLMNMFFGDIVHQTNRSRPLTPLHQVLVALRFFATGSFYVTIADTLSISKSAAGRAIRLITDLLCSKAKDFIHLPSVNDIPSIKSAFYKIAGFPGVIGCVDGTMIKIIAPRKDEADFICRKGYHALNVQMTCDARFGITDVVAKWPGSVHDSRIFRQSHLCKVMEEGQLQGILLGDSGYPLKTFLMTPYLSADSPAKQKFNSAHCRTRVIIEQTYGILKKRFNCLHSGLRTLPERACKVVVACAVLHNLGLKRRDILQEVPDLNDGHQDPLIHTPDDVLAKTVRDHLKDTYFL